MPHNLSCLPEQIKEEKHMKTKVFLKTILSCTIISVMVFIALPGTVLAMSANDPPEGISLGEWQKMQAQIRKAQYHFTADDADKAETYSANNRRNGFSAKFGREAIEIIPKDSVSNQAWNFRLSVSSYGYGRDMKPVQAAEIAADKNRLEYRRGDLTEWYVNDENGMEQGFTIQKPPMPQNVGISPCAYPPKTGQSQGIVPTIYGKICGRILRWQIPEKSHNSYLRNNIA